MLASHFGGMEPVVLLGTTGVRSRPRARFVVAALAAALLGSCVDGGGGEEEIAGEPCPRPEASAEGPDAVIDLSVAAVPCTIRFRDTGVVLQPDRNGARPDPGRSIVRDTRGRFYSTNDSGFPGVIALWNERGEFQRSFGRSGEGPGEFSARGALSLFVDSQDRLHVRDGGPRWSTFDSDQAYLGTVPATMMGLPRSTAVLDDGRVLSSQFVAQSTDSYFRIVDSTGVNAESFGPVDPSLQSTAPRWDRSIAYANGATFWATPPVVSGGYGPSGYLLEEWSIDGTLERVIRREVPWFPVAWPPARVPEGSPAPRPAMQISQLHLDAEGLLLAVVTGPSESWRFVTPAERAQLSEDESRAMYEVRLEVFDARAGVLLASERYEGNAFQLDGLFAGTPFGFRTETGRDLLPRAHIVEYLLTTR